MARIILINPRFEPSFFGMEDALPIMGKRASMAVAALPLLAALTPAEHHVTLIDENIEPIDFDVVAQADIVGVTGMIVQRARMREIVADLHRRGVFVAVGGPWVSVQEDYFGDQADTIFVGEAEDTWPQFLTDWQEGCPARRYEQTAKTDMTRVPTPRFDLLKMRHYMYGNVQFSRGCPFQCEFCDIIVTFGRRPRLKTSAQVIAELEALRAAGMRVVFIVDDNLIGNKTAIKVLLRELVAYQRREGFPFVFVTEASLDLAEEDELLELMVEANIISVFIGIESPNDASLLETKKFQNVRPAGTLVERVHRIQQAGIEVWCGMIVGFDSDDRDIFEAQRRFIEEARIPVVMLGMLYAIPKTPLYDRLARDGRLDPVDPPEFGTNIIPLRLSRAELRDGFVRLMNQIYQPSAYFGRVQRLLMGQGDTLELAAPLVRYWREHPWSRIKVKLSHSIAGSVVFCRLMLRVHDRALRREYRRQIAGAIWRRRDPSFTFLFICRCATHFHRFGMARRMTEDQASVRNSF